MLLIWYKSKKLSLPNKYKNQTGFIPLNKIHIKATFYKEERLCSKKQIDFLFRAGKNEMSHPLKMMFIESLMDQKFPAKAMFVVPKKNFRKAHDRNKLKRRMREAYRLMKQDIYNNPFLKDKKMLLAFIYVGKKQVDFSQIDSALQQLRKKLEKNLSVNN